MRPIILIMVIALLISIVNTSIGGMLRPQNQLDMPNVVYRKGWALVIGINKYPNLPGNQLDWAVADAEAVAELLVKKFGFEKENVILLKDAQATKSNIMEKLNNFSDTDMVDREDCVLFYFSGHGQTVPLPRGAGEMGFLIPYDAKIGNLSKPPNLVDYRKYCIAMNELNDAAKTIPAKHIIFIVDACYSGLVLGSHRGGINTALPDYLSRVARTEVQQMITAGGKGEKSEERPDLGHGVFTYKLLKGLDDELADENGDHVITGTELYSYLTNAVLQMTNGKQNPRFGVADEGNFLFIPQKVEPAKGKLAIQVTPADAVITITPAGNSSEKPFNVLSGEIEIPIGNYNITAEKDGYETASKENIKVNKAVSIQVKLVLKQKAPVLTTIDGQFLPKDAQVFINDNRVSLPYSTAPGAYKIRIERNGYNPVEINTNLSAGQRFSPNPQWIAITKPSALGKLQVNVIPKDAMLSVTSLDNGSTYDIGATGEIDLPLGSYVLTAKREEYNGEAKNITISPNQRTFVTLTLRPKNPEKALASIEIPDLPNGAMVSVDGLVVTPPYLVPPGSHIIRIDRAGFKPYEKRENLSPGQSFIIQPVWVPIGIGRGLPPMSAMAVSIVIPGLGQHLQGHKNRGFVYEGLVLGTGIFAIIATSRHHSTLNEYTDLRDKLYLEMQEQMKMTTKIKNMFDEQDKLYDKAVSARNLALVSQLLFGTVWIFNAFDAGFLIKPTYDNSGFSAKIQPTIDGAIFIAKASF
ncbi:MAG: caspase family protein [Candidatus Poribacteria bacterium]